jgi:hypothetical protein
VDYDIHPYDSVTDLPYPTRVYDYVWRGGATPYGGYDEQSFTSGLNWESPCGSGYGTLQPPGDTNNCVIPGGVFYYPTNFNNSTGDTCYNLRLQPYGRLEIPSGITLTVLKDLLIEANADLDVKSGGALDLKDQ